MKLSASTLAVKLIIFVYHFRFIISPPNNLDVPFDDRLDRKSATDFRALSQTYRRLREFALPLVWARVKVETVKQLGELKELLRVAPFIPPLIRSFRLLWDMDGDSDELKLEAFGQGTALDLAFCDRLQLWDDLMKQAGADIELDGEPFVMYNGRFTQPPGRGYDLATVADEGHAEYDWLSGTGGRGPDGTGEDKLMKNAEQFTECIVEIVGKLTSLETFGWETSVTPMPRGVFDALARLTTLTDLRLVLTEHTRNLSDGEHQLCFSVTLLRY